MNDPHSNDSSETRDEKGAPPPHRSGVGEPASATLAAGMRDLYLLLAGVVLGVCLGPAVFGRLMPDAYLTIFPNPEPASLRLKEMDAHRMRLALTGVTESALIEFDAQHAAERRKQTQLAQAPQRHAGRMHAIILALLAIMAMDAITSHATRRLLTSARYALTATWLAMLLAYPPALAHVPLTLTMLAILVAVAASVTPLAIRREGK